MNKPKNIHFMGIGGSGLAGVALLAQKMGFEVSGCDLDPKGYYLPELKNSGIKVDIGHNIDHLKNVDIVAASPAILSLNKKHPEVEEAIKRGIFMTWQEFMGNYLQKGKRVIAVAGTHGKSTTTALLGQALEFSGLDPLVEVGAVIPQWRSSTRFGKSDLFICEADEYNLNFLYYHPSIIILNNIEMDHPEFFPDFKSFKNAFIKFIKQITGDKILIVNEESIGIREILSEMGSWLTENDIKTIGYFQNNRFEFPFQKEYQVTSINLNKTKTQFNVVSGNNNYEFELKIPGIHNVFNCLGVIACCQVLKMETKQMAGALSNFTGIGRRFDLLGEARGVKVIDDYAHHPTALLVTIEAIRQKYPRERVWVIFEPHQYSRLRLFNKQFGVALTKADKIIIMPVFVGRERSDCEQLIKELIVNTGGRATYYGKNGEIIKEVVDNARPNDIILVAGAGKSYLLSRQILDQLRNRN